MHGHRVYGHRGAARRAPENTLAGLRRARDLGATAVEVDVRLTRDGVCVLLHDASLGRTTDGTGAVAQCDARALAGLDAGSSFGAAFAGEPVPTLAEALDAAAGLGLHVNLELKPVPGTERRLAQAAAAVVAAHLTDLPEPPLVSSFSRRGLAAIRAAAPRLPRALLVGRGRTGDWRRAAAVLGCAALHVRSTLVSPHLGARARAAGLLLGAYTVNRAGAVRRLAACGVDYVFTDVPDVVVPAFAALAGGAGARA